MAMQASVKAPVRSSGIIWRGLPRAAEEENPGPKGIERWGFSLEPTGRETRPRGRCRHAGASRGLPVSSTACCTIAADLIRQQPIGRRKTRQALPLIDDAIGLRQPMANISTMRARRQGKCSMFGRYPFDAIRFIACLTMSASAHWYLHENLDPHARSIERSRVDGAMCPQTRGPTRR
jgi:hypothetical protein